MKPTRPAPSALAKIALPGLLPILLAANPAQQTSDHSIQINNSLVTSPAGIIFIVDDSAAFVIDPGGDFSPGAAAPALFTQDIDLRNIPAGGILYHLTIHDGKTTLIPEP
jgi:hypothetical protein